MKRSVTQQGLKRARQSGRARCVNGGVPCATNNLTKSIPFEPTSKRRKGYPSETHVKRGERIVHGNKHLTEKLGRNDLCPCGSGRRFQEVLSADGKTLLKLTAEAKANNNFSLSSNALNLLKFIEKLRLKPYDDQTGKDITSWCKGATIGYGHLIPSHEWEKYKKGIDAAAAQNLFIADVFPFVRAVTSIVTAQLSQNQFDALVIFVFNIGINGFSSSAVLKLVNDPTAETVHKDLESAWKAWNKSQGIVNAGLVNRRNAEWNIYSKNIYQRW